MKEDVSLLATLIIPVVPENVKRMVAVNVYLVILSVMGTTATTMAQNVTSLIVPTFEQKWLNFQT